MSFKEEIICFFFIMKIDIKGVMFAFRCCMGSLRFKIMSSEMMSNGVVRDDIVKLFAIT
jgi:hypothetical protein